MSRERLVIEVKGRPASKQSVRFYKGRAVGITITSKALAAWRAAILASTNCIEAERFTAHGSYIVKIVFRLPSTGTGPHTSVPDLDNLAKAVLDVLQEVGIVENDCRVARLVLSKEKARAEASGATITVERIP